MSQFSFDGEFRRKPKQNLGGSSIIAEKKELVLQKAREDRERRQRERLIAKSIVVIQSCVRSFLARARLKKEWRADFDRDGKGEYTNEKMELQLIRFNEFYNPRVDGNRLEDLTFVILNRREFIISKLHTDICWQVRIRRIIVICVKSCTLESPKMSLRLVRILTDMLPDNGVSIQWGTICWLHMVEQANFFHEWRRLIERRIPQNQDPAMIQHSELIRLSLSILVKPFLVLQNMKNTFSISTTGQNTLCADSIYSRILYKFTLSFCTDVIPTSGKSSTVANIAYPAISNAFPWMKWIHTLNNVLPNSNFTGEELRNILYAVFALLNVTKYSPNFCQFDMPAFLDCVKFLLISIDNRFAPIPNLPLSNYNSGEDVDEDIMRTSETDTYYEETNILYQKLQDCFNCLPISQWMEIFDEGNWSRLYPIISCIIRLEPKLASVHFKFLPALAYNRTFIRSLYLQTTTRGSRSNEQISAFCWFFCHLIATLHDAEFVEGIPLHKSEIISLVRYLKTLYTNYVIEDKDSNDPIVMSANKSMVSTLRRLHDRNTRIQMFSEEEFHSTFSLILPIDSHSIRFDEHLSFPSETRLPPLEMKLLRVLREFPYSLSFHDRVNVWNRMIHLDRGDRFHGLSGSRENIQIRRNFIYEDAFEKLSPENVKNLRGALRISLVNVVGALEAGVDGGGLLREFLIEATRAAVDPNRGLFRVDSQNRIYPNPVAKKIFADYRNHFFLMGRLVGKALYEQTHLELPFAAFFIQTWITGNVSSAVDYLATLDPPLHKNLLQLKEYKGDWNLMSIDFTMTVEELGETRVVELKKNGKDILVDSSNIIEYIHLVADYKINREMEEECRYFRAGICDVIPVLHIFSWREMQTLISGSDKPIDLDDWAANVNYAGGFTAEHPTIILFWQVLSSFQEKDLRKLLKFVTSCSRPPLLGFKDLVPKFGIQSAGSTDRLPTASTCMNLLKLPELNTANDLREKLMYVIEAEAGFELS